MKSRFPILLFENETLFHALRKTPLIRRSTNYHLDTLIPNESPFHFHSKCSFCYSRQNVPFSLSLSHYNSHKLYHKIIRTPHSLIELVHICGTAQTWWKGFAIRLMRSTKFNWENNIQNISVRLTKGKKTCIPSLVL